MLSGAGGLLSFLQNSVQEYNKYDIQKNTGIEGTSFLPDYPLNAPGNGDSRWQKASLEAHSPQKKACSPLRCNG
ncbi:MAG: hypothetical protein D3917_16820 [Candidatus Electrothrix sp. AX5]|nr:hypothetical protein [Candidatus Electrothrix sp. AX5]